MKNFETCRFGQGAFIDTGLLSDHERVPEARNVWVDEPNASCSASIAANIAEDAASGTVNFTVFLTQLWDQPAN
jgi:hypothetical protein